MWTDAEHEYLSAQPLGRLATLGPSGPQVRPVGFRLTPDTIDIRGAQLSRTQKWRNVQADSRVAFVVDDTGDSADFAPRGVEVRGHAESVEGGDELIRIRPRTIISWGLDSSAFQPNARTT